MRSRWFRRLALLALLALAVLAARYTVFRPEAVPVTVFRVARGPVENTVSNSRAGTVKTRRRAELGPEVAGRVEELPVHEGDRVEEGALLLRLAGADARAETVVRERALESALATSREACARAAQAARDEDRYRRLADDEIVSQEVLDQVRSERVVADAACEASGANARQAEATLVLARVNQAKTVLRAPFAGVVAELSTEVGEWITPSPPGVPIPPVVEIIDPDAIYVSAPMDEVDVGKVETGQPVRITLDAFQGSSFTGRVRRVAPYVLDVQEQNRTFEIEVELDDRDFARSLLPGTSADVEVVLESKDDALRIPAYALMEGSRVLVLREGTLEAVDVQTGLRNWQFAEITSGLEPGDSVVVSLDRAEVQAGARARVAGETLR